MAAMPKFLETLGLDEEPMGIFYTDTRPVEGFTPEPMDLPTREKEIKNEIDWQAVFSRFSCVMGNIWRARKKKRAAYFGFPAIFNSCSKNKLVGKTAGYLLSRPRIHSALFCTPF